MDGLAAEPLLLREVALIAQWEAACNSLHTVTPYSTPKAFHWKAGTHRWPKTTPTQTEMWSANQDGTMCFQSWGKKRDLPSNCWSVIQCCDVPTAHLGTNSISSPQLSQSDSAIKKQLEREKTQTRTGLMPSPSLSQPFLIPYNTIETSQGFGQHYQECESVRSNKLPFLPPHYSLYTAASIRADGKESHPACCVIKHKINTCSHSQLKCLSTKLCKV